MQDNDNSQVEPELIDKEGKKIDSVILAQINQHSYTDRPDLFIESIEKHYPGFIEEVGKDIVKREKETYKERHRFGKFQAYSSLIQQHVAGLAVLIFIGWLVYNDTITFWKGLVLVVFYAVSQGGVTGFMKIINAISSVIGKGKDKD